VLLTALLIKKKKRLLKKIKKEDAQYRKVMEDIKKTFQRK